MIIYGTSLSPFVRKVLVFAQEKGLALEVRVAGFGTPERDFLEASPFGKIPALRDGDFVLSDSTAIAIYLDSLNAEQNLIPNEPRARSRTIWFDEFADTILAPAVRPIFFDRVAAKLLGRDGDPAAAESSIKTQMPKILAYLESVTSRVSFLVENRLTLSDISIASHFVNLKHAGFEIKSCEFPALIDYINALIDRSSFHHYYNQEVNFLRTSINSIH